MTDPEDRRTRRLRELPRYDLVEYGGYYRDHQMDPAPEGEWVRYDDVKAVVEGSDAASAVHVGDETLSGAAVLDPEGDRPALEWRCFHCDEVFTDKAEADEHFGSDEYKTPACRLDTEAVSRLRKLEAVNARLRGENETLDNDARLWHESEADRVRRIGNVQWWQELDSKQGEILALQERLRLDTDGDRQHKQTWCQMCGTACDVYCDACHEILFHADTEGDQPTPRSTAPPTGPKRSAP